jgi:MSHA biogenesis protein MshQ
MPTLFDRFASVLSGFRHLAGRALLCLLLTSGLPAGAVTYTFPGNVPLSCLGGSGIYVCATLTLGTADVLNFSVPTSLTVSSNLNVQGGQLNAGGSAANLTLVVTGTLSTGAGAKIIGNVTAGAVSGVGAATFGGNVATTVGTLTIGSNSTVAGNVSATTGAITLGGGTVVSGSVTSVSGAVAFSSGSASAYTTAASVSTAGTVSLNSYAKVLGTTTGSFVSAASYPNLGGVVTALSSYVSFGDHATVTGHIVAPTYVYTGLYANIIGNITSGSLQVDLAGHTTVTGNISGATYVFTGCTSTVNGTITSGTGQVDLCGSTNVSGAITANGTYVNFGSNSSAGGSVVAKTYVDLGYSGSVTGDVTAQNSYINGDSLTVTGDMSAGTYIDVHSNGTYGGSFTAGSYVNIVNTNSIQGAITANGGPVYIYSYNTIVGDVVATAEHVYISSHNAITGNVTASYYVSIDDATAIVGDVTSTGSFVNISSNSSVSGSVTAATTSSIGFFTSVGTCVRSTGSQSVTLWSPTLIGGACCGAVGTCSKSCLFAFPTPGDCQSVHHLALQHSTGTSLTCSPATVTIVACANASCSALYTGGLTGTLAVTGGTTNFPAGSTFTIPYGSSTTTLDFQVVTAGTVTLGATATSTAAKSATTCNFGSPSCTFAASDSGFLVSVPHHVAGTVQTATIAAVQKSATSNKCTPAFAGALKSVRLTCGYSNPASGIKPVVVGLQALNATSSALAACDGTGQAVSLLFNASGVATTTLSYADAGQVTVNAAYSGSGSTAGLSMTGSGSFIAAPASFAFSAITGGPIKAGRSFSATVSARNALGAVTPNFGAETPKEGVRLSWTKVLPIGTGASSGTFAGSGVSSTATGFSGGALTLSDLSWTEVGTGDLTAVLGSGSYLGSGFSATGTTGLLGAVGAFVPDHFDVAVTQGCGAFTYSGQPFLLGVSARNALGGIISNYNGTAITSPLLAQVVSLSAATNSGLGSFTTGTVPVASFVSGVAAAVSGTFTFTDKLTPPTSVLVRATDATGVSSATGTEGSVALRSGRLRFTNAFGSEKSGLSMQVQLQHWSASKTWVLNSLDSCTVLPAAAVVLGNFLDATGQSTSTWSTSVVPSAGSTAFSVASGNATLTLAAPTATNGKAPVGTVDVGINLGATTADSSCLATPRPASTGANLSWLRAQFGSKNGCLGVVDYLRDPSARATFGVYAPEVKRVIHATEGP